MNVLIIPHTTTIETKCGIYVMFCTSFAYFTERNSLSISARIMGAGKENINVEKLMRKVFPSISPNDGLVKKSIKCLNPTKSLPRIPFWGLKFSNAMVAPYIGP